MRPNSLVVRTYLMRGALLWLGARLIASAALGFAEMDPLRLPVATTIGLVVFSVLIGVADVHRRHERALLGNLGLSRGMLVGFLAGPPLCGEAILSLVASLRA